MKTAPFSRAAADYIHRMSAITHLGKCIVPIGGEILFLNIVLNSRHRHSLLVLCYHGVVPDEVARDPRGYGNVSGISEFSMQMELLAHTKTPVTLSALDKWLYEGSQLADNSVLVTFDDGYRNNLEHASGILLRYGIPAVIFPTVNYIGTNRLLWLTEIYRSILLWPLSSVPLPDGSAIAVSPDNVPQRRLLAEWVREACKALSEALAQEYLGSLRETTFPQLNSDEREICSFLSWDEISRLRDLGFTIGSHTMSHSILSHIESDQLRYELEQSKIEIEKHLDVSSISIAYPNGDLPLDLSIVEHANYKLGFTTNAGVCTHRTHPLALDRICIPGKLSRRGYQSRISGLHDFVKRAIR